MTEAAQASIRIDDGPGHPPVIWLDNGILRIGMVPAAGGRVLSVQLHEHETVWRDSSLLDDGLHPVGDHAMNPHDGPMREWINYGGDKTWPAPQGWAEPSEWHGPPDPVLDSGRYTWEIETTDTGPTVTLTSAHDPRTGLTISRRISLEPGSSAYGLSVSARNSSEIRVRWAVWNVMQCAADKAGSGGVWAGVNSTMPTDVVPLVAGTGNLAWDRVTPDIVHVPHQDVVGKVGLPASSGWIAHTAENVSTALRFPTHENGEYPDGGSRAEVWMEYPITKSLDHLGELLPRHRIVEIEALSPLVTLEPDERVILDIRCGLSTGSQAVKSVTEAGHWGIPRIEEGLLAVAFHPYQSGSLQSMADGEILGIVEAGHGVEIRVDERLAGTRVAVATFSDVHRDAGTIPDLSDYRDPEETRL